MTSQLRPETAESEAPVAARRNIEDLSAVSKRPANDDNLRKNAKNRLSPKFIGSRHFWAASAGTVLFSVIFAIMMGFSTVTALLSLVRNPAQYSPFLLSILVIAGIQWLLALSAHRQAVNLEIWRRLLAVSQRPEDPTPILEQANRTLVANFDRLSAELDARLAALDERTEAVAIKVNEVMQRAESSADLNVIQMRSIAETVDNQREALQRISATISAEVLPIINKLEGTVSALDGMSQGAGGVLGLLGSQLQQSTRDLHACLDEFNRANHTVAPEIEKRIARFEATINRLPGQIEAALNRLSPMSDTITEAAMLSTANVDVMEQISKQIAGILQNNHRLFQEFSDSNTDLFRQSMEGQIEGIRGLIAGIVNEESERVSNLARELGVMAETASLLVGRLQQPVSEISGAAEKALGEMNTVLSGIEQRMQALLAQRITEMNAAGAQVASVIGKEIDALTSGLQSRLEANSADLLRRVSADTSRFEGVLGDMAEQTSQRVASVIRELPSEVSLRMDMEVARMEGALKGLAAGLSERVQGMVDAIPDRLAGMTRETTQSIESDIRRSFESIVQRSEALNRQFRKNATETSEAVLGNYVDFIFMALDRFRSEIESLGSASRIRLPSGAASPRPAREVPGAGAAAQPASGVAPAKPATRAERLTSSGTFVSP